MTSGLELVEFGALSLAQWVELTGHEPEPFGRTTAALAFRPKERHLGFRDGDGRLVAAVGATIATVVIEDCEPFDVVGVGALIVRKELRGQRLSQPLMDGLRTIMAGMGPDRAMLFCELIVLPLHAGRGYRQIPDPVWVDQPEGRLRMPLPAMWRPLRPSTWPPGRVDLQGLPF
jgi:hypothetical protein